MKRLRLAAAAGTAITAGAIALVLPNAQASAAVTGTATGFASVNGGTTGGAGGTTVRATTGTQIHQALCSRASSSTPITIEVTGTINHGNTTKVSGGSCNTAADKIELKDVSNVTIVGVGSAVFDQLGIHIRNASNIIIQNVTVQNVKKSGSPTSNGGDAIGMETDVHNVWVDHATLIASGGESAGYDGLFDMKDNTNYVTLSYSILRNSGRGGLVGSSDSDLANGPVTFHHNWYENIDSRTPLLRGATAHIYNNYYHSLNESGINARAGGKARVDSNYFKDSRNPLGTFYTDLPGYWQVSGNIFDNVTWEAAEDETPAGPNPVSNTSVSIPYSFTPDGASCVPAIVQATAGANTGLKTSDGKCSTTSPTSSPTSSPTPSPTVSTTPTQPSGTNLSLSSGAGADGSSKASGTSYGNVKDGSLTTYWSPSGTTGDISIKWGSATTVSRITIREITAGVIGSYQVLNGTTGAVLKSGTGAGVITFPATSLTKITFRITGASGTPKVAEFETYAS
ncbi:pectate lyase [Actinoplanes ianthinogenes]|uniref:Pectate lyase n=1 Tax=Actinoplanes ianthinogenes TaxID=122358 RepID=A0ABN6CQY2_9ACTN|nr:right-handed parallel beta-helix repeat-containing protein [Actinoplanes ianthinogenes]BCJ47029.1 pectate lyase [Actinoplanes ianthinogenes]GGR13806.1 pectate lyase [Actinoplanes ianthinogenes]